MSEAPPLVGPVSPAHTASVTVAPAPLLAVDGLVAGYGAITALHGVSLRVDPGEIVALIGGNGAGKSTLLCCISGLVRPRAGAIALAGRDLSAMPTHLRVAAGVAHCPEGRRVFARMSVGENLRLGATSRRDGATAIAADLERVRTLFPVLAQRDGQVAGTLSGGEQQMLALGRALMARPRLLLLDEPSLGLAPLIVRALFEVIAALNRDGMTVLLVEQNARAALRLAHRGVLLEGGRVVAAGTGAELAADPIVRAAYLGG